MQSRSPTRRPRRAIAALPATSGLAVHARCSRPSPLLRLPDAASGDCRAGSSPINIPWPLLAVGLLPRRAKVDRRPLPARDALVLAERDPGRHRAVLLLTPDEYIAGGARRLGRGAARLLPPVRRQVRVQPRELRGHRRRRPWRSSTSSRRSAGPPERGRLAGGVRRDARRRRVVCAFAIATAISLSGGAPQFQKLPEMIQFGALVALANTSLALLAVSVMWIEPRAALAARRPARDGVPRLPRLPVGAREARATRVPLPVEPDPPALARSWIRRSSRCSTTPATMFRAELAEVVLYPRGATASDAPDDVRRRREPPR